MQGFFYNRYKPPSKNTKLGTETDTNVDQQLWYHVIGTPQKEDTFVYAEPEHPTWFIGAEVTDDGRQASLYKHLAFCLHVCPATALAQQVLGPTPKRVTGSEITVASQCFL